MPPEEREQTIWGALLFFVKAWAFRARRSLADRGPRKPLQGVAEPVTANARIVAESRSPLYASLQPDELLLQAGKVQNLRLAAACLNGRILPAGQVFSFWAHVPRPTRRRGFAAGRELREGCVIPSTGGGLCQLSNALYDAALNAGCDIVERHGHSRILPGSMAEAGRDATIFWNYVDLRFRPPVRSQLEVLVTRSELVVRLRALQAVSAPLSVRPAEPQTKSLARSSVETCETCGVTNCFRHIDRKDSPAEGGAAWLVDEYWPELGRYLEERRRPGDWLFLPFAGRRVGVARYPWVTAGFAEVRQAFWETLVRSAGSRRLAAQGAARQEALLRFDEKLARRYARAIPVSATHLVISQNLLPFLWRSGVLGGRTFDVLMTRLPLAALQAALDRAHARWPESPTIADFRADPVLVADEGAALAEARQWVTPHATIARLAGPRAVRLDWELPPAPVGARERGAKLLFPAATLCRKGAYEVRAAARRLGLAVALGGRVLEDERFWDGVDVSSQASLDGACAAVLPAWVEHRPRRLLQALAAGLPVLATHACGLDGLPGVISLAEGDTDALENSLAAVLALSSPAARANPPGRAL